MIENDSLRRIECRLREVYGDRLQGVALYGSFARGEVAADSDVDILVLLNGPVDFGRELRTIIRALYPLQLEVSHPIDATSVDIDVYK